MDETLEKMQSLIRQLHADFLAVTVELEDVKAAHRTRCAQVKEARAEVERLRSIMPTAEVLKETRSAVSVLRETRRIALNNAHLRVHLGGVGQSVPNAEKQLAATDAALAWLGGIDAYRTKCSKCSGAGSLQVPTESCSVEWEGCRRCYGIGTGEGD